MIRLVLIVCGLGFASQLSIAGRRGPGKRSIDTTIADDTEREFAKDITSLIVESTLKSKCDGNVFVVTTACQDYMDHVLESLSEWAPPVIIATFHDFDTISSKGKEFWNTFLSWKRRPCSLIFVCDLIKPKDLSAETNDTTGMEFDIDFPEEPLGYINFPRFFSSYDQILYFSQSFRMQPSQGMGSSSDRNTSIIIGETEASILKQTGILLSIQVENRTTKNPETVMRIKSKCNFCGPAKKRQETDLGFWQRNKTQFGKFFEVFENYEKPSFNNSNLTIGYFNYPPHFNCTVNVQNYTNVTNCTGVEWDIIKQIGKSLQFQFVLTHLDPTNDSSKVQPKSTKMNSVTNYTGMIEALQEDRIDLAVGGISVTSERIAMIDFSKVFVTEPIVFVVEKSNNIFVLGIWLAFQPEVWPVILLLVAIISFLFRYIINRPPPQHPQITTRQKLSLSIFLNDPNRIPDKKPAHVRIFEALEITLQPLVGQPLNPSQISSNPRRLLKLLLVIWWFSCLIITTLYNTSLITSLINPVTSKEPESVQDLIDFGYKFKLGCTHGSVYELIISVTDNMKDPEDKPDSAPKTETVKAKVKMSKLLRQIRDRLIVGDSKSERNSLIAYITEESATTTKPNLTCSSTENNDIKFQKTKIIRERLFLTGYGFALKPQAAYKEKIDTALARLGAGGLIDYWYSNYRIKDKESTESKFRLRKKLGQIHLDLEILQGAFIFLIFGCSFAGIVFGIEHLTKRYTFRFYTKEEILFFLRFVARHVTWFYNNHVAEKPPVDKKKKKNQEKFRNVVHTVVNLNSKQQYKFLK